MTRTRQMVDDAALTSDAPASVQSRVIRVPVSGYSHLNPSLQREYRRWRARLLLELRDAGFGHDPNTAGRGGTLVSAVDNIARELLALTIALAARYGTPDLGNKIDPVDELVYIILSRRTREGAYQAAFDTLKSMYPSWEALAEAPADEIERAVHSSGLGRRKARSLKLALGALIENFGRCTLDPTRSWSDDRAFAFLCALPEVGAKSAACVMVCSLDRPAFPVDAHVGRVFERLGTFRTLGIELAGTDHKVKQRLLWDVVPPSLRYPLHVNMVMHGRTTCLPRKPRCQECVLAAHCIYGGGANVASRASRIAR